MNGFSLVSFSWKLVSWSRSIENITEADVEFSLFMAILAYQMVARIDLCMFLGLIIWKLSSLELSFFSIEMTDDSYYGILQFFPGFLVWFHQAEAKYGEIPLNKQQQHSLFPTFPVRGFSVGFLPFLFLHKKKCGDIEDFRPAQWQGVRISCLH